MLIGGLIGAIFIVGLPVGLLIGGLYGKQKMQAAKTDYEIALLRQNNLAPPPAPSPYIVTPEQAQALAAAQSAGRAGGAQGQFTQAQLAQSASAEQTR